MTDYVKSTNFTSKDSLASGNPLKIIKGTEFDIEFNNIAVAVATKAEIISPALTGTPTAPTATAGTSTTQLATTAFVTLADTVAVAAAATAAAAAYPTKSGSGATGTWDISISGNAATATSATTAANGGVTSVNGNTGAVTVETPTAYAAVGTYVIGRPQNTATYAVNSTIAGSSLYTCNPSANYSEMSETGNSWTAAAGQTLVNTGTWRCVSPSMSQGVAGGTVAYAGLWVRIS